MDNVKQDVAKLEHNDRIDITDIPEDTGSFLIIHQGEQ